MSVQEMAAALAVAGGRHLVDERAGPDPKEPIEMIMLYTVALALSSSMCFVTCLTVFKWTSVTANACHGTFFMFFVSKGLWFFVRLVYTFSIYLNGRVPNLRIATILFSRVVSDSCTIAACSWFIASVYELQRWVFRPRSAIESRRAMRRYNLTCYGLALLYLLPVGTVSYVELTEHDEPQENDLTTTLYYTAMVIFGIRLVSIVYPLGVAVALHLRGDDIKDSIGDAVLDGHSFRNIRLVVTVFCVLNVPFLFVDSHLFSLDTMGSSTAVILRACFRMLPYSSGAATSFIMGYYLTGFDEFYKVKREPPTVRAHDSASASFASFECHMTIRNQHSFFVVSD
ncbi:hypothetical protein SPRG_16424 [Saprolegnia parasitica CBS 223.65]|uniref:G-protein coupled receptors family 1 profile domain-containing protein n=1 Tax=Saprolegnia parasitica (strain CBS 223.65) TaxID=695850 RepID=A0A067BTT8_SAPPC|nr:hypothetical protein SPRG_16424 [Saprolegnia parasitica CBS 223.65]KDO18062.1 hypothetical protein SPRG_16424 [Saprolegnia parasitica CBS 223.65]|eukprot:XP_012211229.1 hypothetical protein SPRG_16424 [Saprolegnia parasitica CBS 223.65]